MANLLIGITGSVAAYKSIELVRLLTKQNHQCKVIISNGGLQFITTRIFAALRIPVFTDDELNLADHKQALMHIDLAKWADKIIIAPASANAIANMAYGLANNLLYQVILASTAQKLIFPAMNYYMWQNQITQDNLLCLVRYGFIVHNPSSGIQACGDDGLGRMLEPSQIVELINLELNSNNKLNGKTILITAGATIEAIDPVRYISNHSSGKMALALAYAALKSGAKVIFIYGKVTVDLPYGLANIALIEALSADEMLNEVLSHAPNADVVIGCAAVCDYKVKNVASQKIKKTSANTTLTLIQNPDIIATCQNKFPKLFYIGFAAETDNLIEFASKKLIAKHLDLIVANDVSHNKVFGQNSSSVVIIDKNLDQITLNNLSKSEIAIKIISLIAN